MIAHIRGQVIDVNASGVIIDVNGLGYFVKLSGRDLETVTPNAEMSLFTHFAVRENGQDLYGFAERESKALFELLLSVSGVGPKVALGVIELGEAKQVKAAIASGNVAYIVNANGVGKRGAEKIIVELKDKVGVLGDDSFELENLGRSDDAVEALVALGYSAQQANQALAKIDASLPLEKRITTALKELS